MISFISGTIKSKNEKNLVLEAHELGYDIYVPAPLLEKTKIGSHLELYTHLHVREDAIELYGFATAAELSFFKQLIGVSGVGPKSAVGILSLTSVSDLKKAISHGDASLLTKVSGIGKKTAERLIVELKSKVDALDEGTEAGGLENIGDNQAIDGLVGLGYSIREAREALQLVDKSIGSVKDRIRAALKLLGKSKHGD
jgi:holliday junction DNA helicase RuvA